MIVNKISYDKFLDNILKMAKYRKVKNYIPRPMPRAYPTPTWTQLVDSNEDTDSSNKYFGKC